MPAATSSSAASTALEDANDLVARGRVLDAIDHLHRANLDRQDPEIEVRLAALRHEAFSQVEPASRFDRWPVEIKDIDRSASAHIPQIQPADLDAESVRRAIHTHGSVHVPGLFDADLVRTFKEGIDRVLALRAENQASDNPFRRRSSWLASLALPREQAQSLARPWVAGDGGVLACDSPHLLELLFSAYERLGIKDLLTDYLGERPIMSANKCTLRRARLEGKSDWHQDGAFLGSKVGIRAVNVWVTLTDCGVDAPGMDIVPKRFDSVQRTGVGGAIFDWAVGPDTVAELSTDAPVVRPRYKAGDAMIFDDMLLHRTALDPSMTSTRHAIESWFFAKTDYPVGQVPLVW